MPSKLHTERLSKSRLAISGSSMIEFVKWVDSCGFLETIWLDPNRIPEDCSICETIGWNVKENDDVLVLAGSRDEGSGAVSGTMMIPKLAILERYEVEFK